jgi:hypothetical protein
MLNKTRIAVATLSVMLLSVTAAQALPDHLQCHKIKDSQKFKFADVTLTALQAEFQVPDGCTIKGKAKKFCVPVGKVVSDTDAPGSLIGVGQTLNANDYLCYKLKCAQTTIPDTLVTDQFGERNISKIKFAQEICVPAVKGTVTAPIESGTVCQSVASESGCIEKAGTWDGTTDGILTFQLLLTEATTFTWDARGSTPNTNPTVGLLVGYMNGASSDGTSDGDDLATYPDEENSVEFLMQMTVPAGTYDLSFEGTEGQDAYSYTMTVCW